MAGSATDEVPNNLESLMPEEEQDQDKEEDVELEGNGIEVFGNSLIMERICGYSSPANLLTLRLVNYHCHQEASKEFRKYNKPIAINTRDCVEQLLLCIWKREALCLNPFLFTSFEVNLNQNFCVKTLMEFGKEVGSHINRYCFKTGPFAIGVSAMVAILLSYSTNLTELQVEGECEIILSEADFLLWFPTSFPRLRVLGMSDVRSKEDETRHNRWRAIPERDHPLLDLMINCSPQLKTCKLPAHLPTVCSRIFRELTHIKKDKFPAVSFEGSLSTNNKTATLTQELMQLNLNITFPHLSIQVNDEFITPNRMQSNMQKILSWLKTQSSQLTDLQFDMGPRRLHYFYPLTFTFPPLLALKNLTIIFPPENNCRPCSRTPPLAPFQGNPFPALETLCITRHRDDHKIFAKCVMPSVQELKLLQQHSGIYFLTWHRTFPNLVTLRIQVQAGCNEVFSLTLSYILSFLTRLVNLDIEWTEDVSRTRPESNWDILTGLAPWPNRNHIFLLSKTRQQLASEVRITEEHLKGEIKMPSLRHMKALKTLRLPRHNSDLEAIWYMTRAGLLVPLDKLIITQKPQYKECRHRSENEYRMPRFLEAYYYEELSQYHKEVVF